MLVALKRDKSLQDKPRITYSRLIGSNVGQQPVRRMVVDQRRYIMPDRRVPLSPSRTRPRGVCDGVMASARDAPFLPHASEFIVHR